MNQTNNRKKIAIYLSFFIALIAIPLTVYLAGQQQETRSRASIGTVGEETVVAIIDGRQITKAQVRKVAEESYSPPDVDAQALRDALTTLEERMILDKAGQTLQIQANSAEVSKLISEGYPENEAKYEVLRNQVKIKAVRIREAFTIQFWNTPDSGLASLTQAERDASEKQLIDGIPALEQAEDEFNTGKSAIEIGDALLKKYPSLLPVLAINGNLLEVLTQEEREAIRPQVFEYGDSGLDEETKNQLFALSVGAVKMVSGTSSNKGGVVFKVTSANDSGMETYDKWYLDQKAKLVNNLNLL